MLIKLPSGRKVRCESHRRFYLIYDSTAPGDSPNPGKPGVQKRSDSLDTIKAERRRQRTTGIVWYVADRVTGKLYELYAI